MSTVKWAKLFTDHSYPSSAICARQSFMAQELANLQINTLTCANKEYFSPSTTRILYTHLQKEKPNAVFVHSLRDLWLVSPALKFLPQIKLLAFARMFLRDVNKNNVPS